MSHDRYTLVQQLKLSKVSAVYACANQGRWPLAKLECHSVVRWCTLTTLASFLRSLLYAAACLFAAERALVFACCSGHGPPRPLSTGQPAQQAQDRSRKCSERQQKGLAAANVTFKPDINLP